jgi:hypothetical protein
MRTRSQRHIEQVAGLIMDAGLSPESAGRINAGSGWTFDFRYEDKGYLGETWERVEGLQLSPSELTEALRVAAAWEAGNFEEQAR